MGDVSENFNRSEFACKCGVCGFDNVSDFLISKLQIVRTALAQPMVVTSGTRCSEWNAKIKGSAGSSHVPDSFGLSHAVDIKCDNSIFRQRLLEVSVPVFDRIGIHSKFLHFDVDANKSAGVVWLY
jgi:zinc D-Ala-D-Ala carboxypeptidase